MFLDYYSDFFGFNFNKHLTLSPFSGFSLYNNPHSLFSLLLCCNAVQFCNVSLLKLFAIVSLCVGSGATPFLVLFVTDAFLPPNRQGGGFCVCY